MHDEASHLPITIVRPSIIGSTWLEPTPGWIDNLNGATGMMTAQYKGILRIIPLKLDGVADIIPVDVVSNMLIAAGWQRANMSGHDIPIIHCTSGQLNPITWGRMMEVTNKNCHKNPLLNYLRDPNVTGTMSPSMFALQHTLYHVLPAYFLDFMAKLTGSKPILVKVVKKLEQALMTLWYFFTQEWYFASKNLINLHENMSEEDRKTFNIDIRELDWQKYVENYQFGIRAYILRDDLSTLPLARRKAFRNKIMNGTMKMALLAFVLSLINRKTKLISKLWYYLQITSIYLLRFSSSSRKAVSV
jgi:fatty acyl-CoA reductase